MRQEGWGEERGVRSARFSLLFFVRVQLGRGNQGARKG